MFVIHPFSLISSFYKRISSDFRNISDIFASKTARSGSRSTLSSWHYGLLGNLLFLFFFSSLVIPSGQLLAHPVHDESYSNSQIQSSSEQKIPPSAQEQSEENEKKKEQKKDEELEELIKELEQLPREEEKEKKEEKRDIRTSGALNLNRLNPEISLTGDIVGLHNFDPDFRLVEPEDGGEPFEPRGFEVREIEFSFVSMLDPYSRMKVFISYEEGEIALEEGYAEYMALPGGLRLSVGRQYQQLGLLNRWHQHALPWVDRPPAMVEFLGEENLAQTGLHLAWLLPKWLTSSGELNAAVLFGDSELFSGNKLTRPAWAIHLNNFQTITDESFFEFGGSLAGGYLQDEPRLRNLIASIFARFNWTPAEASKYRGLDIWTEIFINRRDVQEGDSALDSILSRTRWGGFLFAEYRLNRRLITGIRFDYVQRFEPEDEKEFWVTPYLTIWQSEWVRLRVQYTWMHTELNGNNNRIMVQLTWAAGPHKHEAY